MSLDEPYGGLQGTGELLSCTYTPLSATNEPEDRTSSLHSFSLENAAEPPPAAAPVQHQQQQQLQHQQQQQHNDDPEGRIHLSSLNSGSQGPSFPFSRCSSSIAQPTRSSSSSSSNSSSSNRGEEGAYAPFSVSFLPSLSILPPLIHRYTGTSTESLLVGLLCCLINIVLYITSGVLTRVLQQQEHQVFTFPTEGDQHKQQQQQQLLLPPCPPQADGHASPPEGCSVRTPEMRMERLRVPYLMVWLPEVCQIIFLFISLRTIKKKYYRRRPRSSTCSSSGSSSSSSALDGPGVLHLTGENASANSAADAALHAGGAEGSAVHNAQNEDLRRQPSINAETEDTAAQQHLDWHHAAAEPSLAVPHTAAPAAAAAAAATEASFLDADAMNESAAAEEEAEAAAAAGEDRGGFMCWARRQWLLRVYRPYLEAYDVSVHAFLNEELKYEGLCMLIAACFSLMCLFILQGWCWSFAVGATGMSVCSVTAIYNTNSLFVFLFTSLLYKEGADDFIQIVALILAAVGVALITYSSQGEPQSSLGVFLSVLASAAYGLFEVLYKGYLLQNRSTQPLLFVFFISGVMGALALLFMWLPLPLLYALGLEVFTSSMPPPLACFLLVLSCLCSTVYNILLQVSLLLLPSPMLVAMCFLLSLPPAALTDALRGAGGGVGGPGCLLIGCALLITAIKEWNLRERETETEQAAHLADLCVPFNLSSSSSNSSSSSSSSSSSNSSSGSSNSYSCKR